MRLRALFGAAVAAVLSLAALPSVAEPHRRAIVRADRARPAAGSSAACAGAAFPDSVGGHLYKYCGQYWPLNKLPVRIHVNRDQAPDKGAFQTAVNLAVQTWDALAHVSGTGPRPAGCGNARIICVATISDGPGAPSEVDVKWEPGTSFGLPGIAHVVPPSGPISDVTITLNRDLKWFDDEGDKIAAGVGSGAVAGVGCGPVPGLCPWVFDLVGILMHELGHALGLEDLNPGASCDDGFKCGFPADPLDAPDYTQVMYAFYYPGSSLKRVPEEGDILGLQRVLLDSAAG